MAGATLNREACPRGGNKQALNPMTLHILAENTQRQGNYLAHRQETIVHLISNKAANWPEGIECLGRYLYTVSSVSVFLCTPAAEEPVAGQPDRCIDHCLPASLPPT